jgi:hypothetical protein
MLSLVTNVGLQVLEMLYFALDAGVIRGGNLELDVATRMMFAREPDGGVPALA